MCAAVMMLLCSVQSVAAASPVRFGLKGGVTINEMKFNESAFESSNRSGYTIGGTMQFIAPVIGLGFDASLMFTRRSTKVTSELSDGTDGMVQNNVTVGRSYIEIPINLRYNINLPVVSSVVTPFLLTGPDFSFLVSDENVKNAWNNKKMDVAWNFGFGLQFAKKIEFAATYGIGLKNSASGDAALYGANPVDGNNRFWTITAAWLF